MPTTEAGKRLLAFLDDPENAQSPLEPQWVDAIEAEAYAMGHNDGKVPWPSRDAARAEAVAAERARLADAVQALPPGSIWGPTVLTDAAVVSRAAVLAIVNPEAGRA